MVSFGQSILEIDLKKIANNHQSLKQICRSVEIAAAVKANCYGLGSEKIVPILYENGCRTFFVAYTHEAAPISALYKDVNIAVLHGVYQDNIEHFLELNLIPVINNLFQLELWQNAAKKYNSILPYILHIDTGMRRLAMSEQEFAKYLKSDYPNAKLIMAMSHLVSSQDNQDIINQEQLRRFLNIKTQLRAIFSDCKFSLSNSGGIFLGDEYHFDLCRPGAALYGIDPAINCTTGIEQVITLHAPIIHIDILEPGESVGYDCTYFNNTNAPCKIATVPIGYADGFGRNFSNKLSLYIAGYKAPIIGLISMDLTVIDLSSVPEQYQQIGQLVEVIGKNNSLQHMANIAQSNQYEMLTKLGNRFKKIYNQ
jgi:alanine racemase